MNKELIALGRHIAKLRTERGLTQENLAEHTGYSTNHIAKLEIAGTNPSFELLIKIASALNVELKDLFDMDNYIDIEFMKKSLLKTINSNNHKKIELLYKIQHSILK